MATVEEVPIYKTFIDCKALKEIEQSELCLVIGLLTLTLDLGNVPRTEKEKARVLKNGRAVFESHPELKEQAQAILGEEWFNFVFSSVLTAE